ncbi:hypothetical protein EJ06DRAFT_530398 [Trichodelitschia bisporula]|uniref:Coenzyme Q-binding protein COQ10 START domain-containing protein n=1 Tax=Trichodelitschia bisporula TaxID=703511 RepID=A0A6G1HWY0_9PEZI|nr:hypothetical protein EJ06DRAFT_530398 [Trichodelitschia bisporula]
MTTESESWPPADIHPPSMPHPVFRIHARTHIAAPAAPVLDLLLAPSSYERWNPFAPAARIRAQPSTPEADAAPERLHKGTRFTLDAMMDPSKPSSVNPTHLVVDEVSHTTKKDGSVVHRVIWSNDTEAAWIMGKVLRAERVHEVIEKDRECEVRTWEGMDGVLAYVVRAMFAGVLPGRFEAWLGGLKGEAEKGGDGL